jgi:hypothetical protein
MALLRAKKTPWKTSRKSRQSSQVSMLASNSWIEPSGLNKAQMTGGRKDNWVCGGSHSPRATIRWSLGSDGFLQMITTQCPGTVLPMVPP